jgi:F0F1-type ATP synthase assembly protein I
MQRKPGMQRWQAPLRFIGLGWFIAACILLGGFGGRWLDNRFDTGPWFTTAGLLAGTATAFFGVYRMIKPGMNNNKPNKGKG